MHRPPTARNWHSGFTLTEMLVSVAVLVIIMTFIAQLMDNVSLSTTLSSKHIDTDNQARLVFDRMAIDFAGMIYRPDVDYIFAKTGVNNGQSDLNDKMFFYSQAPAYFDTTNPKLFPSTNQSNPKSDVALVGYMINTGVDNNGSNITPPPYYYLQRLSKGLTWDQSYPANGPGGISFLTFNSTYSADQGNFMTPLPATTISGNPNTKPVVETGPTYSGTDLSYDTLADQVFRMEFCFQVKDLSSGNTGATTFSQYPVAMFNSPGATTKNQRTLSEKDPSTTQANGVVGDRWYNTVDNRSFILTAQSAPGVTPTSATWAPLGLSDVTAIVVTIAVMDKNSRKTLSEAQLASAAALLPDFNNGQEPTTPTVALPATTWAQALATLYQENASAGAGATIPQFAASQIRVYQHFFYLNNH